MISTKNNMVHLISKPNYNSTDDLKLELLSVEQAIKDYLERVEFYFEEPNLDKLKEMQDIRTQLKLLIVKSKKKEPSQLLNTITKLSNQIADLTKRTNNAESVLIGIKSKLEKERKLRINLHTRLQVYRQEIYRAVYETLKDDLSNLNWVKDAIDNDPQWGLKAHNHKQENDKQ